MARARLCRHLPHGRAVARQDVPQANCCGSRGITPIAPPRAPSHSNRAPHAFHCKGQPLLMATRGWATFTLKYCFTPSKHAVGALGVVCSGFF